MYKSKYVNVMLVLGTVLLCGQALADESPHHTHPQNETTNTSDDNTTSPTIESYSTTPHTTSFVPNTTNHEDIVEDMD